MNIVNLKIKDLKPYEKNAKKHDKTQIDNVAESIKQFGIVQPIVVDKDNVVIIGHCRLEACKKLKFKEVPCVKADELSEEQVAKLRLLDNKLNESEWDFDLLGEELFELDLSDFELDWGLPELVEEEKEVEEDDFDCTPPEQPKAKLGDIYKLANHRLMCGDSTSIADIEKLLDGNKIDIVLTDPPYGISVVDKNGKIGCENLVKQGVYMPVKGDETTETTKEFYNSCVSLGIKKFILFGGNYFIDFLPFSDGWIIWNKKGYEMESNNFADGEMAWCSFHTPIRIYNQLWRGMIKEGENSKRVHPTQKPIRLLSDILKDFSNENNNVLDCFGGSGSTLIACEQTNRNCFMMEYEPHYVDVIINRWEQFTGKKAEKLN